MTELSFLIELLLNHKLPKVTRDAVAKRIEHVEANLKIPIVMQAPDRVIAPTSHPAFHGQSPSTIAALAKHPDLLEQLTKAPESAPVAVIAQTPAAQAAMAARAESIQLAQSGKPEKGRTSPRKF